MLLTSLATGDTFVHFGTGHLAAVIVIGLLSVVFVVAFRRTAAHCQPTALRRGVCYGLAGVLVVWWMAGEGQAVATRTWTLGANLPLHLCEIGAFVTAAALVAAGRGHATSPSGLGQRLYELAYFWGLGGTLQAILTPDIERPFPDFVTVRFFASHGGIVIGVLVMTIGLRMRPRPDAPLRVWLLTVGLAAVMLPFDWLAGVNYMYMMGPPSKPSLYDYLGPWPWSLAALVVVGAAFIALLYSPFWVCDRLRRRVQ